MVEVVAIVVVSEHGPTIDASIRAVVGLKCDGFELVNADMFDAVVPPGAGDNHVLSDARSKAKNFLNGSKSVTKAILLTAPTLEDAARQLAEHGSSVRLGMCIIHCRTVSPAPHSPNCLNPYIEEFFARLETAGVPFLRSADSVVAIIPRSDYEALPYQGSIDYRLRVEPDEAWILDADLTVCIVNYLQHCYTSRFAHRRLQGRKQDVSLGLYLTELMQSRFGDNWLLSYYTGTIVSLLIKTLQGQADARGIRTIRGANEHSLACASFINWRLYRRGYLMVLTSAMVDELKGTLANLQQAGAKGIIVCGDSLPTKWFGFQATINSDSDIRKVLAARNIPFVYLQVGADVTAGLETAAAMLDKSSGPVVIVAAQPALEAISAAAPILPSPPPAGLPRAANTESAQIDQVMQIINSEPMHLLWQCGALSNAELELVLEIAERAGIALCDALSAPGFVPSSRNGKQIESYIGMLGQYGTNQEVYEFLQTGDEFNSRDEQCLFVLKGKLAQIDSPYSDSAHANKLRIVQVNRRPDHLASFADIGIAMPLHDFLLSVRERLKVDPEVYRKRKEKIRFIKTKAPAILSGIPSLPMHPQFFLGQLKQLIHSMIGETNYRYVGMFDVGHCGTLGVSSLPRTDPSFSGWYGRGLMGDALLGAAALATTGENNVVAIIGDGAKHIVPDIVPNLIENLAALGKSIDRNVTIFFLVNNALSVINSYTERIMFQNGGRQMLIHNLEAFSESDVLTSVSGTVVCRKRLAGFDEEFLRDAMLEKGRVNLFSVPVSLNNDGIAIVDRDNWQFRSQVTNPTI